jgi:phosphoglycolate phosphatase-like HAD superfamily hydrolase
VLVDLDGVLGDTRPLWRDWVADAARRARVELDLPDDRAAAVAELDARLGNWRDLLERFAEDRAPVYLRPRADVTALLRRLQADGVRIGVFTDAPAELAQVAVAHLCTARRIDALGPLEQVRRELGDGAAIARSPAELAAAAA